MEDKTFENILKLLLAGGSLTAGAYLTALRSKLASTKKKSILHISFYIVSGIVIVGVAFTCIKYWSEIISPNWFAIIVLLIATFFSVALSWATYKFLTGKYQYSTKELNPVVNKFSKNADKDNIKLLAGDLNFFGESEKQINNHPQYKCLRDESFNRIQILCKSPNSNSDKVRYGKIITNFPAMEIRFYNPPAADLKVRGRIKTLNNVTRLLIYNKVISERYEALELDTAETEGARYSHLWDLIWQLAEVPTSGILDEYKNLYHSSIN